MQIDPKLVKWDDEAPDPSKVKWDDAPAKTAAPEPRKTLPVQQFMGNIGAAAIRGAGSIGASLLTPYDMLRGNTQSIGNPERRQAMDDGLRNLGFQPEAPEFQAVKLGTEVAGTMGTGGALANVLGRIPMVTSKAAPALEALRTAGMSTGLPAATTRAGQAGNMALRVGGGGAAGYTAGAMVNPEDAAKAGAFGAIAPPALKTAGYLGQKAGQGIAAATKSGLGLSTGVGAEAVGEAFRAGRNGKTEFLDNMRGSVPLTDVLDRAKQGLQTMGAAKAQQYRSGMIPIKGDQTVLSLSGIDQALQDAVAVTTFKGQVKNDAAAGAVTKMRAAVDEWKKLDPAQFHTPEGLDALKQKLGGIVEGIPFEEKTARLAANKVYSATKASIEKQAPTYAKVMKDYSEASQLISEIERTLSLKPNASVDTSMRKLQSLMRNNVQTNYGGRLSLAKELEQKGGVDLMPSIAGQAMNSLAPRSLSGQLGGGATAFMTMQNPLMAAALPFQMPRVVGEAAYGLGRATGGSNALMQAVSQNPQLAALMNNPNALSDLGQFAYRAAPVLATSR